MRPYFNENVYTDLCEGYSYAKRGENKGENYLIWVDEIKDKYLPLIEEYRRQTTEALKIKDSRLANILDKKYHIMSIYNTYEIFLKEIRDGKLA